MESRLGQSFKTRGFDGGSARLAAILVIPMLAGCGEATGPSRFASITPASQSVALEATPQGKVLNTSVTLTNTSKQSIAFDPCGWALEKKIEGVIAIQADGPTLPWVQVWAPMCPLMSASSLLPSGGMLQPGASVTIPVFAIVGSNTPYMTFDGSAGEYRVRLFLATQVVGEFRTIPHDLSVSEPFQVTAQ